MSHISKGARTRDHLYKTAKQLFYQKGYEETTVKDIIIAANSALGVFTYHFDSKDSLAVEIYQNMVDNIMVKHSEKMKCFPYTIEHISSEILMYHSFFSTMSANPNVRRFYRQICHTDLFRKTVLDMNLKFVQNILYNERREKKNSLSYIHEVNIEYVVSLVTGMEIQYVYDLFSENFSEIEEQKAIDIYIHIYFSFFVENRERLEALISQSKQLLQHVSLQIGDDFEVLEANREE